MPTNYSGNPANVTTPLTEGIISCSSGAGGYVLVQTSTAHDFGTYDYVTITGVLGTTEANTTAPIEVIDSDEFLLTGVPFVHAYSSGGTVSDLSLTPYFQVPSDGDAATAESINAAIQALADRTQFLAAREILASLELDVTSTQNIIVPPFAHYALVDGCGGGGGGGGGGTGTTNDNEYAIGGAGGGGGARDVQLVAVTPGATVSCTVGAGGAGGASAGVSGADGGFSAFGAVAAWMGGGGGYANTDVSSVLSTALPGGLGAPMAKASINAGIGTTASVTLRSAGMGGIGCTNFPSGAANASIGMESPQGRTGGAAGANGADVSSKRGGGRGAGGAGGGFGSGGAGGDGGAGGGSGTSGGNGVAAVANSGGGGGGGGAGGAGTIGGPGGHGGNGGSGRIKVRWLA